MREDRPHRVDQGFGAFLQGAGLISAEVGHRERDHLPVSCVFETRGMREGRFESTPSQDSAIGVFPRIRGDGFRLLGLPSTISGP